GDREFALGARRGARVRIARARDDADRGLVLVEFGGRHHFVAARALRRDRLYGRLRGASQDLGLCVERLAFLTANDGIAIAASTPTIRQATSSSRSEKP